MKDVRWITVHTEVWPNVWLLFCTAFNLTLFTPAGFYRLHIHVLVRAAVEASLRELEMVLNAETGLSASEKRK